jgi:DNA-binding beta-propeller fold protein YncE
MLRKFSVFLCAVLTLFVSVADAAPAQPTVDHGKAYEVWVIDQSDTTADGGGTLYIYRGEDLSSQVSPAATPEAIDLGGAARDLCLAQTGSAPRRPHMMAFNMDAGSMHSHAIIAFVATGHVLFMEAASRAPVACIDVGLQAHAAMPSPDGRYVVVANQNGKLLQRIITDYATNTFTLDPAATIDLANCTTPSGAACQEATLRPDNAPICPIIDATGRFTFVTLRGGGLFVVDTTAAPMAIVAEYDAATVHPNGCGGVEVDGQMYINAGGGTAANPFESDLYAFTLQDFTIAPQPPNTPLPLKVFSHDRRRFVDSHGAALIKNGRFLWLADRAANRIVVVNTRQDTVANEFNLVGAVSENPAPDLLDVSPDGKLVFVTLRGLNPLTGNAPGFNNAVGSTPGLGIIEVTDDGRSGRLASSAPITHIVNGVETADPHGIAVRHK